MTDEVLRVQATRFSIIFYFVCPHGHVHETDLKFIGMDMESMREDAIGFARDAMLKRNGDGWRLANDEEIKIYLMQQGNEFPNQEIKDDLAGKPKRTIFVLPEIHGPQ